METLLHPIGLLYLLLSSCSAADLVNDADLARISNRLHADDINGAEGFILNLQNRTRSGDRTDRAPLPLFQSIPKELFNRTTYLALSALYDNYAVAADAPEQVTNEELQEEVAFMDAVMATGVMKTAHKFLSEKGLADRNVGNFKRWMRNLWFGMYSRVRGNQGSSGFEHVFLGEEKNGISGLHSWFRYKFEEDAGNMNYLGYSRTLSMGKTRLIQLPLQWRGIYKPVSTILIGPSPELEMALYTICFIARPESSNGQGGLCPVENNGKKYHIQSFSWSYRGKRYIGSSYPTF